MIVGHVSLCPTDSGKAALADGAGRNNKKARVQYNGTGKNLTMAVAL
jgi:hypothetical protein